MNNEQTAHNEAKLEILNAINNLGTVTSMDIALVTNRTPENASMNLLRYHRQGLLSRGTLHGRTKVYEISERGKERLEWLKG